MPDVFEYLVWQESQRIVTETPDAQASVARHKVLTDTQQCQLDCLSRFEALLLNSKFKFLSRVSVLNVSVKSKSIFQTMIRLLN